MRYAIPLLMLPLLLTAACGSDEMATTITTSTQGPSSVDYTPFALLQRPQDFESTCAVIDVTDTADAEGVIDFGDVNGLVFLQSAPPESWSITGDTLDLTFDVDDLRDNGDDDIVIYQQQAPSGFIQTFAITRPDLDDGIGDDDAEFIRIAGLQVERADGQVKNYTCLIGVPLLQEDALPTDSFSFDDLEGFGVLYVEDPAAGVIEYLLDETEGEVEIDRDQGRLRLEIDVEGDLSPNNQNLDPNVADSDEFGVFTADISFTGNPRDLSGEILDENLNSVGEFSVVFFGPQGGEVGVVFSVDSLDSSGRPISFVGSIIEDRDDDDD